MDDETEEERLLWERQERAMDRVAQLLGQGVPLEVALKQVMKEFGDEE